MPSVKELFPPVNASTGTYYDHLNDPWFKEWVSAAKVKRSMVVKSNPVPPYQKRAGVRPNKPGDFGDGGAFPEEGGEDDEELAKEIEETTIITKAALEKIVNKRLSAVPSQSSDSKFIKYKPSQQSAAFNSGAKERIIRIVEMPVDPLDPPKFKHKRVPKASGGPPVPVIHSPPRPVTVKDQQDWKIPPCISNWKNPKGYTIPLDKRLAADGRGLQEVQINDKFAKLTESLYVTEQKAREAVAMRSKVQKEMMMKEKERKEQDLLALAQRARSEGTGVGGIANLPSNKGTIDDGDDMTVDYDERVKQKGVPQRETKEEREKRMEREKIREERRRERESERKMEANEAAMSKKRKILREKEADPFGLDQFLTELNRAGLGKH